MELLFRGFAMNFKKWVYGLPAKFVGVDDVLRTYIMPFTNGANDIRNLFEIYPETICQYTGLTDKNGEKIFEKDIVICRKEIKGGFRHEIIEKGYVKMIRGAYGIYGADEHYRLFNDWLEDYEYEVIGNIYFDDIEILPPSVE